MKILLMISFIIVFVPLVVGLFLPEKKVFVKKGKIQASPEKIWTIITDIKGQESWRSNIREVKIIDNYKGNEKWTEILKNGHRITFRTKTYQPPHRFDIEIVDSAFSGYWEGRIEAEEGGAKVEFKEVVIIKNPYLRVLSYIFLDLDKTMELYLSDLVKKISLTK